MQTCICTKVPVEGTRNPRKHPIGANDWAYIELPEVMLARGYWAQNTFRSP